jgi:hypothetical protein
MIIKQYHRNDLSSCPIQCNCVKVLAIQNLRGFMALLEGEERQICVRVTNINYNAAFLI